MLKSIGAVLGRPNTNPDRPRVRGGSHLAGTCEDRFYRGTTRQEVRRTVLAAKRYELVGRQHGHRNGPLGHVALEVLELLGHLVNYRTGRLDPSIDTLMRTLRRSKDAVVTALQALRTHGFLDWLRRYEPTGREGAGPQIRQMSNAYRMSAPARALRLLGRLMQPSPLPDDVVQAQAEWRAKREAHKASLTLDELPLHEVEDTALGRVLAALGRQVQERESARRAESKTTIFKGAAPTR